MLTTARGGVQRAKEIESLHHWVIDALKHLSIYPLSIESSSPYKIRQDWSGSPMIQCADESMNQ
jgi:hypothetical protein